MSEKKQDANGWIVAGGIMIGSGVGFFFLSINPLYFVGCSALGLGLGLLIGGLVSSFKK